MKADARRRLGRLFNPADYPPEVRGLFGVEWDFPSVEPPDYLSRLAPDIYRQEQERVAERFEEAVRLAEQAFVAEFARLVSHLTERLNDSDGERRIFRDTVVTNLSEFFERFRQLNVRSNQDLDDLVGQAQQMVRDVTPQDLRDNDGLRQHVATRDGGGAIPSGRDDRRAAAAADHPVLTEPQRRPSCTWSLIAPASSTASTPRPST